MPGSNLSYFNRTLKDVNQLLPSLDEINRTKFPTLDAKKGFWMIQLSKQSSEMTAFSTPFGKIRYLRLPLEMSKNTSKTDVRNYARTGRDLCTSR